MIRKTLNTKILLKTIWGIVALFVFVLFTLPIFSHAQIPIGEMIIIKSKPESPRPGQVVTISIESYSTNLDRAQSISWYIDDVLISQDVSANKISFEAKGLGNSSNVKVVIATENGSVTSKSIVIRPSEVDILWEADSYVPPLYKGKALPSSESEITFVAMARIVNQNGSFFSPNELIYKWRQNGKILGKLSGRGKNSITILGPSLLNTDLIHVEIESVYVGYTGSGIITVEAVIPMIIMYEKSPLLGPIYENAIGKSFSLTEKEVTVVAHPYFFSSNKRTNTNLKYSWRVDGRDIDNPSIDQSSLTLRQVGEESGTATVLLTVRNLQKILQMARSSFSIQFQKSTENNFSF